MKNSGDRKRPTHQSTPAQNTGMKVFIIESSYPEDFYCQKLDGIAAQGVLNILGIRN